VDDARFGYEVHGTKGGNQPRTCPVILATIVSFSRPLCPPPPGRHHACNASRSKVLQHLPLLTDRDVFQFLRRTWQGRKGGRKGGKDEKKIPSEEWVAEARGEQSEINISRQSLTNGQSAVVLPPQSSCVTRTLTPTLTSLPRALILTLILTLTPTLTLTLALIGTLTLMRTLNLSSQAS